MKPGAGLVCSKGERLGLVHAGMGTLLTGILACLIYKAGVPAPAIRSKGHMEEARKLWIELRAEFILFSKASLCSESRGSSQKSGERSL